MAGNSEVLRRLFANWALPLALSLMPGAALVIQGKGERQSHRIDTVVAARAVNAGGARARRSHLRCW